MSYARFGSEGSDVYVYADIGGFLCCCGCRLNDRWRYDTTDALLAHLRDHQDAGHHVPAHTLEELEADRDENDCWIREYKTPTSTRTALPSPGSSPESSGPESRSERSPNAT